MVCRPRFAWLSFPNKGCTACFLHTHCLPSGQFWRSSSHAPRTPHGVELFYFENPNKISRIQPKTHLYQASMTAATPACAIDSGRVFVYRTHLPAPQTIAIAAPYPSGREGDNSTWSNRTCLHSLTSTHACLKNHKRRSSFSPQSSA